MATVGQPLTAPEAGWKRYDDWNQNITYEGGWTSQASGVEIRTYNKSTHYGSSGAIVKFNFTGSKLRLIGGIYSGRSNSISLIIDGTLVNSFSQYSTSATTFLILDTDIKNLEDKEHYVQIINTGSSGNYLLDAIDIDENGELLPYNPVLSEYDQAILRVTMIDSSEREFQLPITEINGFAHWHISHVSTDTASYILNKKVGSQNSKEYLAFEKIISFEVIPVA